MKLLSYLTGLCLFISITSFSQSKTAEQTETIKVWGNCGMCKGHIEKAAKEAGATSAVWNKNTKVLSVTYESSKTSNRQIQEKVAAAGYDTRDIAGDDKAYDNLDDCCKYERKSATKEKRKKTAMNCCSPEKSACCHSDEKNCC
ncbi:heavy-metal-associated domain-containing protein [Sediminibacterium soli]|uniref:heavy-metal-associated domain-containing protein n=1 Tax=Sediminibacterium soli TaxID=2698829 RepID=UPI00137B6C3B|nr:heavy-metal-associated domain-containing protein [Sediminibacterium soli]NCI45990.1 heavy-metal-associated domain-containing protein [Sediminibacterium soli]